MNGIRHIRCSPLLRQFVALAMSIVFLQGFASAFLHFEFEDHYWCPEHHRMTHNADHARRSAEEVHHHLAIATPGRPKDDGKPHKDRPEDDVCQWMLWLHASSMAWPHLQPEMLNLPPPRLHHATASLRTQASAGHPIPIRHVSPINSPPRV